MEDNKHDGTLNNTSNFIDVVSEKRLRELTHNLYERVKELNCLYGISRLVEKRNASLEDILKGIVEFIPPAWQYPEITCAHIQWGNSHFKTANYWPTTWRQVQKISVSGKDAGVVEVYYLESRPLEYEGPFLKEERALLDAIAERIGHILEREIAEDNLHVLYEREKKLRKRLQLEMQLRVDFTRKLMHELKTPLTSLMATSQLLVDETRETRLEKLSGYVWDGANNLNRRVDELHDVIRGEIGTLKVSPAALDLRKLIAKMAEENKALLLQQGMSLNIEIEEPLPRVNADPERVRQVLSNLINNAYQYAVSGGKIDIEARKESDTMVVIAVRDYGPGISKEKQKKLFKPGYQVAHQSESAGGLGIGLTLCKRLVELHGGKMGVKSKVGQGAEFYFTLPVCS